MRLSQSSERPEQSPVVDSSETRSRRNKVVATAAAVVVASAVALGLAHDAAKNDEMARQLADAAEISQRYDCKLLAVEDLHQEPEHPQYRDGNPRTTLRFQVELADNPAAAVALARYENDDTVMWSSPSVGGSLNVEGKNFTETLPFFGADRYQQTTSPGGNSMVLTSDLYPRTDYPDRTSGTLYVENNVTILGDNDPNTTVGTVPCGTIVFDAEVGEWHMGNAQELPDPVVSVSPAAG